MKHETRVFPAEFRWLSENPGTMKQFVFPVGRLPYAESMLHSTLFPDFPCDGELVPIEGMSKKNESVFWCSSCGTEFTFFGCGWVIIVYPGMKSDLPA